MRIILNDFHSRKSLYPFTQTRHTAEIRVGILTIREKWELLTGNKVELSSEEPLPTNSNEVIIEASLIPTSVNFEKIIAAADSNEKITYDTGIAQVRYPWHICQYNHTAIENDFFILTRNRVSQPLPDSNRSINPENIFIEEGAKIEFSIINASGGPVYIGKDTHIMEGNMIRGPFALCEGSVLKMGSKIYSGTTIGPWCIAGGEIKNTVFFGYSNKAHDGYLGDSVIGEWCNLGAGTSNSNLKNSAADIQYTINGDLINAGNKSGLLMGDYSRAAINTSFNTGSIVGICCNIFGREFPDKKTADFTWGNSKYIFDKALEDIAKWKKMKNSILTDQEIHLLKQLYLNNQ